MEKEERLEVFRINLTKLANADEGSFVIFDAREKFVQFAGGRDLNGFVCDIPFTELSEPERMRLLELAEFSQNEGATNADSGEQTSYTTVFDLAAIDKAVQLTERIFVDVFLFPPDARAILLNIPCLLTTCHLQASSMNITIISDGRMYL